MSKVLVPIGFSEYSDRLIDYAVNLCTRVNGELHLIHGIEIPGAIKSLYDEKEIERIITSLESKVNSKKEEILEKQKIQVHASVILGRVYESILNYQKEHKIDWLVIGANGSESNQDFIGANTLRVLRESYSPTISLKGDCSTNPFSNVIVPLDLTNEVNEKLRQVQNLNRKIPGLTYRLVCVSTSRDEFVINRMTRHLGHLKSALAEDNIKVSSEIITGVKGKLEVPDTILDYTRKVKGDLIFIMTQKEQTPVKYFLGSVAQQLINQDIVPVMSNTP